MQSRETRDRLSSGNCEEAQQKQSPIRVPVIMMDSMNSQQIRSKSTFRGTGAGFNSNKISSF